MEERFKFRDGEPVIAGRPTIIHWAGPKPWRRNAKVFSEPMLYFRRKALKEIRHPLAAFPDVALYLEELVVRWWKFRRRLQIKRDHIKKRLIKAIRNRS